LMRLEELQKELQDKENQLETLHITAILLVALVLTYIP